MNPSISQTITLRYNRIHGVTLLIYHGVYNTAEALNTIDNHSNIYANTKIASQKVTLFFTQLNNARLQEYDLVSTIGDDWTLLKDELAENCILSSNIYYYNWFW